MEQIFGTQGTEDISAKILKTMGQASLNADKVVGNYQNATDKAWEETKTFFDKIAAAWRKLEATFIKTAGKLAKDLAPVGDLLLKIAENIGSFAEKHPLISKIVLAIIGLIAVLGTLGAAIQVIGMMFTFAFAPFGAILGGITALFSPLVLAIIGVVAAVVILYKNWDSIWSWIKEKFQSAKDFLLSGLQTLKNIFSKGLKLAIDFSPIGLFLKLINMLVQKLFNLDLKKAGQKLIQTFTDGILSFIKKPFEIIDKIKEKAKGILKFFGFGGEEQKADFTKIQNKSSHFTKEIVEKTSAVKKFREIQQKEKSTREIKLEAPISINAPVNITSDKQNPEDIRKAIIQAFREGSTELKWALEQALKDIQNDSEGYIG